MIGRLESFKGRHETLHILLSRRFAVVGLAIVLAAVFLAVAANFIAPYDPSQINSQATFQPPNVNHLLGTDNFGRDMLSRVIYGARISMVVGVASTAISLFLGLSIGVYAGYRGGIIDSAISSGFDILLSFPSLLLAILFVAIGGTGYVSVILVVIVVMTPLFGRVVRGAAISIREKEYIEAAKALAQSERKIILRHVIPNLLSPVIVLISISMVGAIILEAGLSFLGLGFQPPTPSWGADLRNNLDYIQLAPWIPLAPGLAIMITILGFNILGDALRDALDPKLRF